MTIKALMKSRNMKKRDASAAKSEADRIDNGAVADAEEENHNNQVAANAATAAAAKRAAQLSPSATKTLLRTHSQTPDVSRSITIMCIAVTTLFVVFQTPYIGLLSFFGRVLRDSMTRYVGRSVRPSVRQSDHPSMLTIFAVLRGFNSF